MTKRESSGYTLITKHTFGHENTDVEGHRSLVLSEVESGQLSESSLASKQKWKQKGVIFLTTLW